MNGDTYYKKNIFWR